MLVLELILLALAFLVGSLLVTLLLLRLTRNCFKILRLLPLAGVVVLWVLAWQDYNSAGWFSGLAAFADFAAGLLVLLGWGLAFAVLYWKRRRTRCRNEEDSGSSAC